MEGQSGDGEYNSDPLCGLCQTGIHCLGLVLAEEGVGRAGDCAGETRLLAGLEQYDKHKSDTDNKLNNLKSQLQNNHSFLR